MSTCLGCWQLHRLLSLSSGDIHRPSVLMFVNHCFYVFIQVYSADRTVVPILNGTNTCTVTTLVFMDKTCLILTSTNEIGYKALSVCINSIAKAYSLCVNVYLQHIQEQAEKPQIPSSDTKSLISHF